MGSKYIHRVSHARVSVNLDRRLRCERSLVVGLDHGVVPAGQSPEASSSSRSVSMSERVSLASPMASLLVSASLGRRFFGRAWMPAASVMLVLPTLAFHVHPRSFSRSSMRSADRRFRPFLYTVRWSLIH